MSSLTMNKKFQYHMKQKIQEISIGIENFEFIVSERVQVNPDNWKAMSALTTLLLKLNTLRQEHKETLTNHQTTSEPKTGSNDCGVLNLYHGYCITITMSGGCFVITQ